MTDTANTTTATIISASNTTGQLTIQPDETVIVAAAAPVNPPRHWFDPPEPGEGVFSVEVSDDGHVLGYPAASWSDCHLGYPDRCVTPPRSSTDYAYFTTGQVATAEGDRVRVGQLCLRGGHADLGLSAAQAMAHYDDTDSAFADVAIGENEHGIWIAGALRPNMTPAQVRTAMASGLSGDWRPVGGGLELIALSAVNTPGFRAAPHKQRPQALAAAFIAELPQDVERPETPVMDDGTADRVIERIAASVGLSFEQQRQRLAARVGRG